MPTGDRPHLPEIALCATWHRRLVPASLRTVDGRTIDVIHRGAWTHGFGPDFRDAMILLDGRSLQTGGVELHLRTGGWREHGHHLDARYNDVILHVVQSHDGNETRRQDGALVPIAVLPAEAVAAAAGLNFDWSLVGGEVCAEALTKSSPNDVRAILWRLGDTRLAAKTARIEARLAVEPPGEVLYQEICDGLGFAANREPMLAVANRLKLSMLEAALATVISERRLALARGLLFGVAGFLPLSPVDATFAGLSVEETAAAEEAWRQHGTAWHDQVLPPTAWTRARVRPANHPARRLAAGAALIAAARAGLVATVLEPVRRLHDPALTLRELASVGGAPGLGEDRARGLIANGLVPFALALAEHTEDQALADAVAAIWERLPAAEPNEITRRAQTQVAGDVRLPSLGARGQQGLIHLDGTLCAPRRCYECPIAWRVLGIE